MRQAHSPVLSDMELAQFMVNSAALLTPEERAAIQRKLREALAARSPFRLPGRGNRR